MVPEARSSTQTVDPIAATPCTASPGSTTIARGIVSSSDAILRLEDHLLLANGVVLVVVRALAVGARLPEPLRDLEAGAFAQPPELATERFQAGCRHERGAGWVCDTPASRGWLSVMANDPVAWECVVMRPWWPAGAPGYG